MKILALDSSGIVASVAVVEDDTLLAEYTVNYKKTHSQTLLPMLDEIVKMTELELESVDAIAVAAGPGSFTGLRIGSATAKGLGLALKKPLVAVPTVDALAYNLYDAQGLICPIMDARRKQVYTGIYRFEEHQLMTLKEQYLQITFISQKQKLRKNSENEKTGKDYFFCSVICCIAILFCLIFCNFILCGSSIICDGSTIIYIFICSIVS